MTISRLFQALLLILLVPVAGAVVIAGNHHQAPINLTSLSISANGNATMIGGGDESSTDTSDISLPVVSENSGVTIPLAPHVVNSTNASVSINANVQAKNESAVIIYDITGSSLKIGDNTYNVANGTGIFNQHSLVVVLHATVSSGGSSDMLILIGHAENALSTNGEVGVTFDSPQSKLAGQFFLSLSGKLTLH